MKIGFYHDTPLVYESGIFYTKTFGKHVWDRYLGVFEELVVSTRVKNGDRTGLGVSNHPHVEFLPIKSYTGPASLLKNFPKILDQISSSLHQVEGAIVRLPSVIGLLTCLVAKVQRKPILIEVVGCAWDAFRFHSGLGKMLAPFIYLLNRVAIWNGGFVIYVTNGFLQRRYPTKGESVDISNVNIVPDETHLICRRNRISDLGSPSIKNNRTIILGSIGKIDLRYKGHESALVAVAGLINSGYRVEYQIVGEGDPEALLKEISRLGIKDHVKLVGLLPSIEVSSWLDTIDIYIQPSLAEGLPRSAIEAMSHGLPLILSRAGGHSELVGSDFLYTPGKSKELQARVVFLLEKADWNRVATSNFERSLQYDRVLLQAKRENFLRKFRRTLTQ